MRKNKTFFEQMDEYKFEGIKIPYYISYYSLLILGIAFLGLIEFQIISKMAIDEINYVIAVVLILLVVAMIFYLVNTFRRNSILFRNGNIFSGIQNFIIFSVVFYVIYFIVLFTIKEEEIKGVWLEILMPATTLFAAILTLIGVHYSLLSKKKEDEYNKNLVFLISSEGGRNIFVSKEKNRYSYDVILENKSQNTGYLIAVYSICGNNIYSLSDKKQYVPILPFEKIKLNNINFDISEESVIIVYKDICENFYFINLVMEDKKLVINSVGKCDMDFLEARFVESKKIEQNYKIQNDEKIIESYFDIQINKEKTKPKNIHKLGNYELITDEFGVILTDMDLLKKLKDERRIIAKENNVKEYIVFSNHQLVAIATYKPKDKLSFVSIYGLGQKKYDMYGERIIGLYN